MGRSTESAPTSRRARVAGTRRRGGGDGGPLLSSVQTAITSGVVTGELASLVKHWALGWGTPDILDDLVVRTNPRLRTTIARWVIAARCLELGPRFFALRGGHAEILCHELAHAAALRLHGPAVRPHGPEWRGLVRQAGYAPTTRHRSHRSAADSPPLPRSRARLTYEHRCAVCHGVRFGKRPVKTWRCPACVGAGLPGHLNISVVARGTNVR